VNKTIRFGLAIACASLLGGCATGKYQCPTPTGVACMSAPGIYDLTNAPGKAGIEAATGVVNEKGHGAQHSHTSEDGSYGASTVGTVVTPLPKPGDVIPIREASRVMRIWISPWEDTNGNLVMATRIYTEIEPKRWSVGEAAPDSNSGNFFPMQVDESKPAAAPTSTVSPVASAVAPGTEPRTP